MGQIISVLTPRQAKMTWYESSWSRCRNGLCPGTSMSEGKTKVSWYVPQWGKTSYFQVTHMTSYAE